MHDLIVTLRARGIQPTPQRLAVAKYVLDTRSHLTAEEVWERVLPLCPTLSRATVYNTLNLMAEKGLVRVQQLGNGGAVFDAHVERHHHLVDEDSGNVIDLPWEALSVTGLERLDEYEISECHVVLRGRRKARSEPSPAPPAVPPRRGETS